MCHDTPQTGFRGGDSKGGGPHLQGEPSICLNTRGQAGRKVKNAHWFKEFSGTTSEVADAEGLGLTPDPGENHLVPSGPCG